MARHHLWCVFADPRAICHNPLQETAQLEARAYELEQRTALAAEAKNVLDSWVRYEGQVKQREQRELAEAVIAKVKKELENPKALQAILQQSVAEVESELPLQRLYFAYITLENEMTDTISMLQTDSPPRNKGLATNRTRKKKPKKLSFHLYSLRCRYTLCYSQSIDSLMPWACHGCVELRGLFVLVEAGLLCQLVGAWKRTLRGLFARLFISRYIYAAYRKVPRRVDKEGYKGPFCAMHVNR